MIKLFFRRCGETYSEQHAAAYELLYAAAEICGCHVSENEILKTEKGKPYFKGREDVHFSISHSGGYAAVVIGDIPCGVDIEGGREISERVSERYLEGKKGRDALLKWTERESLGKLTGEGFFCGENIPDGLKYTHFEIDSYTVTVCSAESPSTAMFL